MKKSLLEAGRVQLSAPEQKVMGMYSPEVQEAMNQSLAFLRQKNPTATLQQAAQNLLATPHYQGNKALSSIANLNMSPANLAQNAPPLNFGQLPQAPQVTPGQQFQQKLQGQRQMQTNKQQPKIREAFGVGVMAQMGTSLQKIMKAVSSLKPEELAMLIKMLNSMMAGPTAGATGNTQMTRTTMTSAQRYGNKHLIETIKKDILKEELIVSIKTQTANYKLVESMLSEGPFSNVWHGIKNAGASALNKIKTIGDKTPLATGQVSQEEQSKAYSGEMMKFIKKAHQTRQQFKSQVLKNAEIINAYHDAVAQTWQSFNHVANSLGPHSGQIQSQVDELVSNLKYDLESEKEQIQSFLKVLGDLKGNPPDSGMARGNAEFVRNQEADAARRMKNPITGKRMSDSRVDPEIIKDIDRMNGDDAVFDLVNRKVKGDKNIGLTPQKPAATRKKRPAAKRPTNKKASTPKKKKNTKE